MTQLGTKLPNNTRRLQVGVLAYEGLCLFEYACAMEVLASPPVGYVGPWYDTRTVTLHGEPVTAHSAQVAGQPLSSLRRAHMLVIPAWSMSEVSPELIRALRAAHARGTRLVAICTGSFVLAAAGLLAGRRATTHWRHGHELLRVDPTITLVPNVLYVDDGDVVTSAGAAAGIDLLLHLVRRDFGLETARLQAQGMVVQTHREGAQRQFADDPIVEPPTDAIARAVACIRDDPVAEHDIASLAAAACMSMRSFHRHFVEATGETPHAWLVTERLALAKNCIEAGHRNLEEIARQSGFASAELMRRHFKARIGITPRTYAKSL